MSKNTFLLLIILLVSRSAFSQRAQQSIQQSESLISSSNYGLYFRGYNGSEVTLDNNGKSQIGNYDLGSIRGRLFWNDSFHLAKLYLQGNKLLGEFEVKYEMLNMVFYVKNGKDPDIKVIDPKHIEKIEFLQPVDGGKAPVFTNTFYELSAKTKDLPKTHLQELLKGPISIYKKNKVVVRYQDSLFGSIKKPFLADQSSYYVIYKGDFKEINRLAPKTILGALPTLQNDMQHLDIRAREWNDEKKAIAILENLNLVLNKREN